MAQARMHRTGVSRKRKRGTSEIRSRSARGRADLRRANLCEIVSKWARSTNRPDLGLQRHLQVRVPPQQLRRVRQKHDVCVDDEGGEAEACERPHEVPAHLPDVVLEVPGAAHPGLAQDGVEAEVAYHLILRAAVMPQHNVRLNMGGHRTNDTMQTQCTLLALRVSCLHRGHDTRRVPPHTH